MNQFFFLDSDLSKEQKGKIQTLHLLEEQSVDLAEASWGRNGQHCARDALERWRGEDLSIP